MKKQGILKLPKPRFKGEMSLEEALGLRRTTRRFLSRGVNLSVVSQLLWALQGTTRAETSPDGRRAFHRAAPSAGGTYPLEVYVAFSKGLFRYEPRSHELCVVSESDVCGGLAEAASTPSNQEAVRTAPLTIVLAADNERALRATPLLENALRFTHLEAGHAAQNLVLQAVSLGLGACTITSFHVAKVYEALKLPLNHRPIYLLPVGFQEK